MGHWEPELCGGPCAQTRVFSVFSYCSEVRPRLVAILELRGFLPRREKSPPPSDRFGGRPRCSAHLPRGPTYFMPLVRPVRPGWCGFFFILFFSLLARELRGSSRQDCTRVLSCNVLSSEGQVAARYIASPTYLTASTYLLRYEGNLSTLDRVTAYTYTTSEGQSPVRDNLQ